MNKIPFILATFIAVLFVSPTHAQFSPTGDILNAGGESDNQDSEPIDLPATGGVINENSEPLQSETLQTSNSAPGELTEENITTFLKFIATTAIQYVLVIAAIFIMLAGYVYITSFGNKQKVEQAKTMLLYTIIGVLVVLGGYIVVNTVVSQIGL